MTKLLYIPEGRFITFSINQDPFNRSATYEGGDLSKDYTLNEVINIITKKPDSEDHYYSFKESNKLPYIILLEELEIIYD